MKITGSCSDSSIIILEEELPNSILESICKIIEVQEVIPVDRPLRTIKTFEDFARFCIFPFIQFNQQPLKSQQSQSSLQTSNLSSERANIEEQLTINWNVELWPRAPGLLAHEQ